ncbi:MAG: nuclear transport factor 2 family protein [Microvirga sp.]
MPPLSAMTYLLVRAHIEDVLKRYTRAVDRLDEAALRSCFHPSATMHAAGAETTAASFCDLVVGMLQELELTHHQIGNIQIDFDDHATGDGTVAFVETYFTAIHRIGPAGWSPFPQAKPGEDLMMRGRYVDRFEDRAGQWAIAHRAIVIDWARFDPPDDRGIVGNSSQPRGGRDYSDPVYHPRKSA